MLGSELFVGQRVRLVALTREDAPTITSWYQDGEFMRMYDSSLAFPKTEDEVLDLIASFQRERTLAMFGVRLLGDNRLIGMTGLDGIDQRHGHASLSIALGPAHWGQGLGCEAFRLLLRYAFMELNLHHVTLTVFEYNERALALYRKLGFQLEGTCREHLQRDGRRYDMYLMGMLASEWLEREVEP